MASPLDVTGLLDDWTRGDLRALDRLLPLVYDELRRVAARRLRRERAGHSLQPTALVHETCPPAQRKQTRERVQRGDD